MIFWSKAKYLLKLIFFCPLVAFYLQVLDFYLCPVSRPLHRDCPVHHYRLPGCPVDLNRPRHRFLDHYLDHYRYHYRDRYHDNYLVVFVHHLIDLYYVLN